MTKRKLISTAPGRLWTPWLDVYWGKDCIETFDCKWTAVLPFMTVEWQPGKYDNPEND